MIHRGGHRGAIQTEPSTDPHQGCADISGAAHGVDHTGLATGLEFLTEIPDVDIDDVACRIAVIGPHRLSQLGARKHYPRVAQQVLQKPNSEGREVDPALSTQYLHGIHIHPESRNDSQTRSSGWCRRSKRSHPGEQLPIGKRLGEVVVGPGVQALDPVGYLGAGGEHQDGQIVAAGSETPADAIPSKPGIITSRISKSGSRLVASDKAV